MFMVTVDAWPRDEGALWQEFFSGTELNDPLGR